MKAMVQDTYGGGRWLGGSDRMLRAPLLSPFVGQKLGNVVCSENH
jgi:hypothetical protein